MKLTIEDVAEMTGFTPGTVREYARRMGLGKKEGRRKYLTKADVKQIESGELPKPTTRKSNTQTKTRSKAQTKRR